MDSILSMNALPKIIFNSDNDFFVQLLDLLSIQNIHPNTHSALISKMKRTLEIGDLKFFEHVRITVGSRQSSLYLISLMKMPGRLDAAKFKIKSILLKWPKVVNNMIASIYWYSPVFFYTLDVIKDIVFISILRNTLDEVKDESGDLANSRAEQLLWIWSVGSVVVTHAITGFHCFLNRSIVFNINAMSKRSGTMLSLLLIFICPILPMFYMIRLARWQTKLQNKKVRFQKKELSNQEYLLAKKKINQKYVQKVPLKII